MRAFSTLCIVAVVATVLPGCAQHTQPVGPEPQWTGANRNFRAVWHASIEVLRKYSFRIDRQDRRAGVITTEPLLGKHFFEFWRRDAVTGRDMAESSLQTIYRTVTVTIGPTAPGAATYKPIVEVQTQRSDGGDRGVVSTTDAYDLFVLPGRDELRERKILSGARHRPMTGEEPSAKRTVKAGPQKTLADRLAAEIRRSAQRRLGQAK